MGDQRPGPAFWGLPTWRGVQWEDAPDQETGERLILWAWGSSSLFFCWETEVGHQPLMKPNQAGFRKPPQHVSLGVRETDWCLSHTRKSKSSPLSQRGGRTDFLIISCTLGICWNKNAWIYGMNQEWTLQSGAGLAPLNKTKQKITLKDQLYGWDDTKRRVPCLRGCRECSAKGKWPVATQKKCPMADRVVLDQLTTSEEPMAEQL